MSIHQQARRALCAAVAAGVFTMGGAAWSRTLDFKLIAGGALGDGGPATAAYVQDGEDVVRDAAGNLYVAEYYGNRIRKITADGSITTIAGGVFGFGGDGGPAANARIDGPQGLLLDSAGNLYFTELGGGRVRRIATNGTITTIAGNGTGKTSGDGGPATQAGLNGPWGVVLDAAGNLYITESAGNRIRKVDASGTITTVAGTGIAGSDGDGGPAASGQLNFPAGIDIDAQGNLYVAEIIGSRMRKIATDGTLSTLFEASVEEVEVGADGALYFVDESGCYLKKWAAGTTTTLAGDGTSCDGSGDGGSASAAGIGYSAGVETDGAGNVIFSDIDVGLVRKFNATTGMMERVAGTGPAFTDGRNAIGAPLSVLRGIAADGKGNIAIADSFSAFRGLALAPSGALRAAFDANVGIPYGVAYRADGKAFLVLRNGSTIYGYSGESFTLGGMGARGIAADGAGNLFVTDYTRHLIRKLDLAGTETILAGTYGVPGNTGDGGPAASALLTNPTEIAADRAGNVYFSEGGRIRRIGVDGIVSLFAGIPGTTISPDGTHRLDAVLGLVSGLAVDDSGLYFTAEGKVRRITPQGVLETLEGLPSHASGVAVRHGRLYVSGWDGRAWRAALVPALASNDYDHDTRSDLLWRNAQTGAVTVWKAANNTTQLDVMDVSNLAWKIVGQGDFDGDGTADLFWRNSQSGANTIWRSANNATQTVVAGVSNPAWTIAGVGDFDGDGTSDLLWRNGASGQNVIWHAGDIGTQTALPTVGLHWKVVGVGDFDGDRRSDILWRNGSTGANAIWRSGNAATQQVMTGVNNLAWKVQGVGDFDGDGKSDVFWRNTSNGTNTIWRSANNATQITTGSVPSQQWSVVAVGDYDGDGKSDLAWRNSGSGANAIWRSGHQATQMVVAGVGNPAWSVVPYENQR